MVVRPKGESAMAARSARNRTLLIVNMGPKLRNIQSLKAVSAARKRAPCHRLAISAVASTASGMKKTGRLIGWDGRSRMQGQNDWHCWPRQTIGRANV